ncbi:MAG: TolC family protein [Cytophagales bacterium]
MNKNFLIVGIFGFVMPMFAQNPMTLEQCVSYALENNNKLASATLDEAIAKMKVGEIRAAGLPQISGTAKLQQFDPLQRLFVENTGGPFLGDPNKPVGEVIAFPNFFQLPASAEASVSASQLLFSSSYIMALKAAKGYQELSKKNTLATRNEVVANVSKAYYQCVVAKESANLFETNIKRLDTTLHQLKEQNKAGFVEKLDVNRLQVSLNNLKIEKEKFDRTREFSLLLLKYQMNMPLNESIDVNSDGQSLESNVDFQTQTVDYSLRPEYVLLETQKKLNQIDVKNNKLAVLPTMSAFGVYGYNTANKSIPKLLPATDLWYKFALYGLQLNVPIFGGFVNNYKTQQAKLNEQKTDLNIATLKLGIELQVRQAEINLQQEKKNLNSQVQNLELAKEVARVTKVKYEKGLASSLEYYVSESELRTAQINYYTTLAAVYMAKVDYEFALGTIFK